MGFLSKFFEAAKDALYVYMPSAMEERWIGILYAIMTVDGEITVGEKKYLDMIVSSKQMFVGHDVGKYYENAKYARTRTTSKGMIDNCSLIFPVRIRQTLFTQAIEMVLYDGKVGVEETEVLYYLSDKLELDRTLSDNIIKVMLIRNTGNIGFNGI
jgi:uncharacterized tellurite resistance protein B-like protein